MINCIVGGTKSGTLITGALSVGLVVTLLSACDRREADAGGAASPPSATMTPVTPANVVVVRPTLGRENDAVGQLSQPTIPTTGGSSRPVAQGKEGASLGPSQIAASIEDKSSAPETLLTPLAAMGFNPALRLSAGQTAEVVRLGQEFLAATDKVPAVVPVPALIAASADDAAIYADASVHVAWRSAQEESDALFRAKFGYSAFNSQLLMRAQQAYRDQLAAGR